MWLILSLCSAVFFSLSTFFIKKGYSHLSVLKTMLIESIISLLVMCIYLILRQNFQVEGVFLVFLWTIPAYVGYYLYLKAYEKSGLALTSSIISTTPIFLAILAYFIWGQQVSLLGAILIITTVVGVVLIGLTPTELKSLSKLRPFKLEKIVIWSLIGLFANLLMDLVAGKVFSFSTPTTYLILLVPSEGLFVGFMSFIKRENINFLNMKLSNLVNTILGTTFMAIATIFFFEAFTIGKLAYVSALTSTDVILSVFLGVFFLKEKISRLQTVGIVIVTIGVIIFSFV